MVALEDIALILELLCWNFVSTNFDSPYLQDVHFGPPKGVFDAPNKH